MSAKCPDCGSFLLCEICGETEMTQAVNDGHRFVPRKCICKIVAPEELGKYDEYQQFIGSL